MSTSMTESATAEPIGPTISRDLVAGLIMLAFVGVFLGKAGEVGTGKYDWLFPVVLSYALGALALSLVIRGLLGRGERMPIVPSVMRGEGVDVVVFLGLALVYVVAIDFLGFWLSSGLMIAAAAIYLDTQRSMRTLAIALATALAACTIGYVVLTRVFYINFPLGPLG